MVARLVPASGMAALLAFAATMAIAVFADHQNQELIRQRQRDDVSRELSVVRAQLEGLIASNIQLVRGLVGVIATEPDMDQRRFERLAATLVIGSELRSVAGAPDLVVRLVHPVIGNQRVFGLNYLAQPDQRDSVIRARDTRELVLAGPVKLVQGGEGLIGRFPVFTPGPNGDRFWGIVSAVVDIGRLYARAGLYDPDLGLSIAITGRDGLGSDGGLFFGSPNVLAADPVGAEVVFPAGRWQLWAVPKRGWADQHESTLVIYVLFAIAGFAIAFPIWVTGQLYLQRRGHVEELSHREAQLARLSRRLELALDTSRVGVWEMDLNSGDLVWDDRMNELYGHPIDQGPRGYASWRDRLHPDDRLRAEADYARALADDERYVSEFRVVLPSGEVRNIRAIGAVYRSGSDARMVGVNWDVTTDLALNEELRRAYSVTEARNRELELAKARIEHTSLHDALTGLPNRRFLDEHLALLGRQSAPGLGVGVLHIDLDRFKEINDTLGHAAGDAMLVHAADVMRGIVRRGDFLARIGGDEFVVVCVGQDAERIARSVAERLVEAMRQPVMHEGHVCRMGASIGVAIGPADGAAREKLLIDADIALYRAKNRGRNRFEFFTAALQAEIVRAKTVADQIMTGLEEAQFIPYYQPQFDAHTHALIGAEALVRWLHPTEGLLTPDRFLKVADEIGVLADLDRIVLERALEDIARWSAEGLDAPRVSVNVSHRRLNDEFLLPSLQGLRFIPGQISFELVESIYLDDSDDTIVSRNIQGLRDLGIAIEIDDFGTGYASVVSLTRLRPDRLKIDRELVGPITTSASQASLVRSIVEIGRCLDIEIVAEGVETMQHAEMLRDLGCDVLQGYALSKPVSPAEMTRLLREGRQRAAAA